MTDILGTIIVIVLLVTLGLSMWSKVSGMTIPELISEIWEVIKEKREDSTDYAMEVFSYD